MTEPTSKKTQMISLPVPEELVRSANFVSKELGWDTSDLLLHWLRAGTEREMLKMVSAGELSTGKFVELLGVTYWDYHPLREKYGVELGWDESLTKRMRAQSEAIGKSLRKSQTSQQEQQD